MEAVLVTLTIGNSTSQVSGFDAKTFAALRKALSYIPTASKSYFSGRSYNQRRYLIDKRGVFPTGLLYLARQVLKSLPFKEVDTRVEPKPRPGLFKAKLTHTPYPEQVAAATACAALKRGIVVAPTGVGKSLICALIIQELQVPTLIVVPSLTLRHQVTESLKEIFGAEKVGRIYDKKPIAVENVDALKMSPATGYDCVIIDEFHHSGAATYQKLNRKAWGGVYFKVGCTATPFRANENERLLLESVLSQVIYRVTYQTAVDKGYIVPVEAYFIDLVPQIPEGNENSWPAMYSELVVNNEARNAIITNLLTNLTSQGLSTLCLVKEIKHGKTLQDASGVPFANGEDGEAKALIEAFNKGSQGLIGTVGVIGEGVDTKPCEYVILAGAGKSKTQFMQNVGRGVRRYGDKESCKVILFRDASHKWLLTHFKEQCKFLREEYGVEAVKLEI